MSVPSGASEDHNAPGPVAVRPGMSYDSITMAKRKRIRTRSKRPDRPAGSGPSLVFIIALLIGLILLAYLGYTAATTQVTPPSVQDLDYSQQ